MKMPFELKEVDHTEEGWKPETGKEYLVQYRWKNDEDSIFLVGTFHEVWFGHTFHWFWGASSLQLSDAEHDRGPNPDIKNFIGIWEVIRLPEPEGNTGRQKNLITREDVDI